MLLIDSHSHIHDADFPFTKEEVFQQALAENVKKIVCIGVDEHDSEVAINFIEDNHNAELELFACVGVHPHEAKSFSGNSARLEKLAKHKSVIGIGEIGLDYHYNNSSREDQIAALRAQIQLALKLDLPIAFHVRDAYEDFWRIFDEENQGGKIRGILHSFTDSIDNLEKALARNLYIGVNGISTFAKKPHEIEMFNSIPLDKILLETDAPFLAPTGKRGKPNQPAWISLIAQDLATKRGVSVEKITETTSQNFADLFKL
ncbi:MAG: TatD family hydrolase [Candidatus Sacchiramonaceae bacterium]|nr:TatD family hydrolase [Candidatus Saccharimonadaceae bacterium]